MQSDHHLSASYPRSQSWPAIRDSSACRPIVPAASSILPSMSASRSAGALAGGPLAAGVGFAAGQRAAAARPRERWRRLTATASARRTSASRAWRAMWAASRASWSLSARFVSFARAAVVSSKAFAKASRWPVATFARAFDAVDSRHCQQASREARRVATSKARIMAAPPSRRRARSDGVSSILEV